MFDDYLLDERETITEEEYEAWCMEIALSDGLRGKAAERRMRHDMFLDRKHDRAALRLNEAILRQEQDEWDAEIRNDRMERRTLIRCRE